MQEENPSNNEPFVTVGKYRTARQAHEAGLAVLAAGHPYWALEEDGYFLLVVDSRYEDILRREVQIADFKNRYWPPPSIDLPTKTTSKAPTILFGIFLALVFTAQRRFPELEQLGMNSSEGVIGKGEFWRTITAITLHGDLGHLAGNLLGISLFTYLSARYLGNGLAWLLIISVSALSNSTNAVIHSGEPYFSLGASTAVFAALGLLTGFPLGTYLRSKEPLQTRDWLVPLSGGCLLFAWMGGGEFPTDVAGHFWSFVYGTAIACVVATAYLHAKISPRWQGTLIFVAWAAIALSWSLAWNLSEIVPASYPH